MSGPKVVALRGGKADEAKAQREKLAESLVELAASLAADDALDLLGGLLVLVSVDEDGETEIQLSAVGNDLILSGALDMAKRYLQDEYEG